MPEARFSVESQLQQKHRTFRKQLTHSLVDRISKTCPNTKTNDISTIYLFYFVSFPGAPQ